MTEVKQFPRKKPMDTQELLEECKNHFKEFVIVGYDSDDNRIGAVTLGLSDGSEVLWLIECFKADLMAGVYSGDH